MCVGISLEIQFVRKMCASCGFQLLQMCNSVFITALFAYYYHISEEKSSSSSNLRVNTAKVMLTANKLYCNNL